MTLENKDAFLAELSVLTKKHGIAIGGLPPFDTPGLYDPAKEPGGLDGTELYIVDEDGDLRYRRTTG